MYDLAAARAERAAQITPIGPFQFTLEGNTWQMRNPGDLPARSALWRGLDDFVRNVDLVFFAVLPEGAKPLLFPIDALTRAEIDDLISAGMKHYSGGASVGESKPPAS